MAELPVNQDQWKEFFDRFSQRNQSRLVNIEIFSRFGAQKEVKKMPLSGIVYEAGKRDDSAFLEIMLENRRSGEGNHLTHFISNVQSIFTKPPADDGGGDEALEIEDADGNKTLLTFERPPELRAAAFCATATAAARDRLW